ncbi:conserved membrane hypothetical protein [Mesorhizobium prunaredense]|uniref:DUF4239 domain-containing protein n=1 Tax=Mesorhizobium prunaredense TaxID=1631249 RepID=A0A1R3VHK2_9HYPH|nr:hypothetical protein [Mesorhizobium prunaredense]SIT57897.1 conserved membrane hypothetical protein [Mesorhizobium prunaredense]
MSTLAISVIVFVCVLGGALLGMYLTRLLPQHQLSGDAKDVIKVSMAMVATLAALVLGLMTASAKSSLDDKESKLRDIAAQIILLDRTMALYGAETREHRDLFKRLVAARVNQIWPEENAVGVAPEVIGSDTGIGLLQQKILALSPQNDAQRWFQSTALQISRDIAAAQWSTFQQVGSRIHWPFLVIVVFWLTVVFASFGLFAPQNPVTVSALCVAALAVAGAIYLILSMDQPYGGLIKISSAPARAALDQLGR